MGTAGWPFISRTFCSCSAPRHGAGACEAPFSSASLTTHAVLTVSMAWAPDQAGCRVRGGQVSPQQPTTFSITPTPAFLICFQGLDSCIRPKLSNKV